MGVALAAVADDDNLPALDEIEVGIPVVVDAHRKSWVGVSKTLIWLKKARLPKSPGRRVVGF